MLGLQYVLENIGRIERGNISIIIVGDYNTQLSIMDRKPNRRPMRK